MTFSLSLPPALFLIDVLASVMGDGGTVDGSGSGRLAGGDDGERRFIAIRVLSFSRSLELRRR